MTKQKLKIAFVVGALPFGGIEVLLLDAAKEINKRGNAQICIFNLSGKGKLLESFRKNQIRVVNIGQNSKANNVHRIDTLLSLLTALRAFDPDIIHTQHFSADFFGRIAGKILGKPTVTHIHNTKKERHFHRVVLNKILSYLTSTYISVSKSVHTDCINSQHNAAHRPVHLLYNSIDHLKMDAPPIDLKKEFGISGPTVIAIGRLVPQKNFNLLIRAFAKARMQLRDISLLIVGDGGEKENLANLIGELNLKGATFLAGYRSDVPSLLRSSTLFAAPSEYEGFCIAHLEAMYHGLPAVISRNVPSVEIASGAALVCETEVDDLAAKLVQCLAPARYKIMSEEAKNVAARHDMPGYVDQLMRIYRETLMQHVG